MAALYMNGTGKTLVLSNLRLLTPGETLDLSLEDLPPEYKFNLIDSGLVVLVPEKTEESEKPRKGPRRKKEAEAVERTVEEVVI